MEKTQVICPLCNDAVDRLVYRFHYDTEATVIAKIKSEFPEWTKNDGLCSRCLDFFHTEIVMRQRIFPSVGPHFPIKTADDFLVIPTGLRIDADPRFTGKGVTICFIDSGFFPHPDLTHARNRIKKIVDITNVGGENQSSSDTKIMSAAPWHGTMTSVVCAGDGYLSNGLYKGIASDAEVVLLAVMDDKGHITTENICKALRWILENHRNYDIRIVNMSLGDDITGSYKQSEVDNLCEQLINEGITIVAAVGNDESGAIKPPANSPNVTAVGGVDDGNTLADPEKLYHSSYGTTVDGLMKPELMAHAIWIAAPILPNCDEHKESALLHQLLALSNEELINEIQRLRQENKLDSSIGDSTDANVIKKGILKRLRERKYISPHYMHVDGTSFAAPIVSGVIAQLLELDRSLSPAAIREVLFSTAKRIKDFPAERQGFGVIQPRKAVLKILKGTMTAQKSPLVNTQKRTIEFFAQNDHATQISLVGSFNHWEQDVLLMEPCKRGLWKIEIPMLPAGRYQYKFLVDEEHWVEDHANPYREPDGFTGFNSILIVQQTPN